jgi:hypothetical protein
MTKILEAAEAAWTILLGLVLLGIVGVLAAYVAGCTPAQAMAAKPIIGATCSGARAACRLIDQACDAVEGTSGAEAP